MPFTKRSKLVGSTQSYSDKTILIDVFFNSNSRYLEFLANMFNLSDSFGAAGINVVTESQPVVFNDS